jgi:hypothetical protein
MMAVTAAAAPGLACAQRSKNASLPYCDGTAARGEPAATGPQPGYGGGAGPLAPYPGRGGLPYSRLLGGRAWSRHDAQLHQEAEHVRPTPVLGLLAVLHPEEVDPAGGGLLAGRRDADELVLVGAGVGDPGGPRSPSAITSWTSTRRSGKAWWTMPKNCLACSGFWLPKVWSTPSGVSSSSTASRSRPLTRSW